MLVQLAAKRTELLVHVMPDAMRSNQILLSMHNEELYREQRHRLAVSPICETLEDCVLKCSLHVSRVCMRNHTCNVKGHSQYEMHETDRPWPACCLTVMCCCLQNAESIGDLAIEPGRVQAWCQPLHAWRVCHLDGPALAREPQTYCR